MTDDELQDLLLDAVAISDSFHANEKRFVAFYEQHADDMNGAIGIWSWLVEATKAFHAEEKKVFRDGQWYECIDDFVDELHALDHPGCQCRIELEEIAKGVIQERFLMEALAHGPNEAI